MTVQNAKLASARQLLNQTSAATVSAWPRAAAVLARQMLEGELAEFWKRTVPGLERLTMRAQLTCVHVYLGQGFAGECSYAWHALSRCTHHHAYELDPTREELASLIDTVERLSGLLSGRLALYRATP